MWKVLGCGILVMSMLSGCGGSWFSSRDAEKIMIVATPAFEGYGTNQEAFGYLSDEFNENNSFTKTEKEILLTAQGALLSEFAYLKDITTVAGSVPYYEYVAGYKRIKRNYKIMKDVLDVHISEYPRPTQIIYFMTCDNVAYIFQGMDVSIYRADEEIVTESTSTMIRQFTRLYGAVKPLMSTAALAL